MECVRCGTEMKKVMNGEIEVDFCADGCGSMWFDPFELKKMNERSEIHQDFMQQIFRGGHKKVDTKPRINCPVDGHKMLRHFHSVRKEVEVDQCSVCYGHWLDGGELLKIINQFRNDEEKLEATQDFFKRLKSNN